MSVVDEYLAMLSGKQKQVAQHMYDVARALTPGVKEEFKYNLPTLTYKGKGVASIMANRDFMSYYPFCNHETLGVDVSAYQTTKGSIHFSASKPLPDGLIAQLVTARLAQIDAK
jgi:uncharacterized protein YdhG (YjbR/CyaY superfamily)